MKIVVCPPCVDGDCQHCEADGCVCRHGPAAEDRARVAAPRADAALMRADAPSVPQSAPFDLEAALSTAREAGHDEGRLAGYLAGMAEALEPIHSIVQARHPMDLPCNPYEIAAAITELLDGGVPDMAERPEQVALVELDGRGALVSVVCIGNLLEVAAAQAAWTAPSPDAYSEIYRSGDSDPIEVTVGADAGEAG